MIMKKLLGLGLAAAMFASQANAGFIWGVTGADMVGIEVTATFADTSTETLSWEDLGGITGGVTGSGWSLMVDGDTMVPDTSTGLGGWLLTNNSQSLTSLFINLGSAFVFDTLPFDVSANGSGPGREFFALRPISFAFSGLVQDELYTGLMLTNILSGSTKFAIDTDAVPTPATLSLMGLALLGLAVRSRRKQA